MGNAPIPEDRVQWMRKLPKNITKHLTIEPIMDFDLGEFLTMIDIIEPDQINIGADSQNSSLEEPKKHKLESLIMELESNYNVIKKKNLDRLLLDSNK